MILLPIGLLFGADGRVQGQVFTVKVRGLRFRVAKGITGGFGLVLRPIWQHDSRSRTLIILLTLSYMVVSQNQGYLLGGPYS